MEDSVGGETSGIRNQSMAWIIAILSGAVMSIQGVWNTGLTKQTGIWLANTFVQFSAFVICFLIWLLSDRTNVAKLAQVTPKYLLAGGALGVFITYSVIVSMHKLGPAKAVLLIVIAQIAVAYLLELFGLFGTEKVSFEMRKVIGIAVAILGLTILDLFISQ